MDNLWLLLLTVPIAIAGYFYLDKKKAPKRGQPATLAEAIREKVAEAQKEAG